MSDCPHGKPLNEDCDECMEGAQPQQVAGNFADEAQYQKPQQVAGELFEEIVIEWAANNDIPGIGTHEIDELRAALEAQPQQVAGELESIASELEDEAFVLSVARQKRLAYRIRAALGGDGG